MVDVCDDIRAEAAFYYTILVFCVLGLLVVVVMERRRHYHVEHMND